MKNQIDIMMISETYLTSRSCFYIVIQCTVRKDPHGRACEDYLQAINVSNINNYQNFIIPSTCLPSRFSINADQDSKFYLFYFWDEKNT